MTFQQLEALRAVVEAGSFQGAARFLNKTHPSVITAIRNLELGLGFDLIDRRTYRATLTREGQEFYQKCLHVLDEVKNLETHALQIAAGDEIELNIVIGDVTPPELALPVIKEFSRDHPNTQINLLFENIGGPNERLLAGDADIIVHHIDKVDRRYEYKDMASVQLIPVAAPNFIAPPLDGELGYDALATYTQCIIRDTAMDGGQKNYHVLEKAARITVGDQHTKKQVILMGLGWGHMPSFMIEAELESGDLVSLSGPRIHNHSIEIVIARRANGSVGKVAQQLWQAFETASA
ncbi:LysR family transcriptional regulator [Roseovarius sp. CAU 1744]|uniref:LysR family transcriptional regulator n=1 Tax=Roseovarius sp. CAU 1744 TaxID=3140368 RepID=UPI00325A4447